MESRSLVPHRSSSFQLPIANLRSVFRPDEVERKLAKLPGRDHENLRSTYERMLERGPERFQVKPSGLPDMAALYEQLPNFTAALDDVKRHVALSQDSRDGLEVTPMLLLGPPGIGKTHFARRLAELLGTGMNLVPMSSMTAGWLLSGASSQWKGAKPGKVFEALVDGQYANPVIVVDEIDKASADAQYDPLGALYGLLEHDTAGCFMDEFAEVAIDASQVIWIMTANDERCIPDPYERLRDRGALVRGRAPDCPRHVRVDPFRAWLGRAVCATAVGRPAGPARRTRAARHAPRADDRIRQRAPRWTRRNPAGGPAEDGQRQDPARVPSVARGSLRA